MTRIHILANYNSISYYFMYPLIVFKRELDALSFKIKFFTKINKSLCEGDILLIDNRFFSSLWKNYSGKAFKLLQNFRKKCWRIIWLDTTDSTGATQFQVFPFVDRYLKKQLLKDRRLYENNFYGARIYTDYYKKHFFLPNENVFCTQPIKTKYLPKLGISWNLGLGPYHLSLKLNNIIRLLPYNFKKYVGLNYKAKFQTNFNRKRQISFRGSDRYNNLAMAFQRLQIKRMLAKRNVPTESISRREYFKELCSSKICISPFGAGEICFRDFEIIQAGGMLFKPDLGHLETWPDIFIDNETYVSFKWDFSDFDKKISELLDSPDIIASISLKAQEKYKYLFSEAGREKFCKRFIALVT